MAKLRIGVSGWQYPSWRGAFYPKGLAHRLELEYLSRFFNSVEINGSFYSLQKPDSFDRWHQETPGDFIFAIKGSRFISHMKKLKNIKVALANFFASGLFALKEKMGPILWQLPPQLHFDKTRIREFLEQLPQNTVDASEIAKNHDERVKESFVEIDCCRHIQYAFEVRHDSYLCPEFFELLNEFGAAAVIADTAGRFPSFETLTADFVYVRLHGSRELYVSGYSEKELDQWAKKISIWQGSQGQQREVFVYFDNDAKVRAPFDAQSLSHRFGI